MQKKILISGPILSASGYGEMARFALRALTSHTDKFDIYVNPTVWGQTGWLFCTPIASELLWVYAP